MSEDNMDTQELQGQAPPVEQEPSWADAMQDLERQKDMIRAEAGGKEAVSPFVTATPGDKETAAPFVTATPGDKKAAGVSTSAPPNLQFILDIPLQVTVELGRKRLLVHDLLQLSQGSVIELSKQIGEPFEVLINQKLIARGEIVVINDKFGVRITDIISPMERVQQLQ